MPKQIRKYPLFIAPGIIGVRHLGKYTVFDTVSRQKHDPTDVDDKIKIYERQVNEWFLNRASNLIEKKNNGFIVLMICLSYVEGVEQYITGDSSEGHSKEFFISSMRRIYGDRYDENQLGDLYKEARCGLFHNGMTASRIIINNSFFHTIKFHSDDSIRINPKKLLRDVKQDFEKYLKKLKSHLETDLRDNFDSMFILI